MKNKCIKIVLFMFVIISIITTCFANEDLIDLKYKGHCGDLLKLTDKISNYSYVVYEKNGKEYPVYCLDNDLAGVGETISYPVKVTGKYENEEAWRAIKNGYPYKTPAELGVANEYEAFTATKAAVNMILNKNYPEDRYLPLDTEESQRTYNAYRNILKTARESNEKMITDLTISIIPESNDWTVDTEDNNYISKYYHIDSKVSSGSYSIEIQNEVAGIKIVDDNNFEKSEFNLSEKFKIIIPITSLTEDKSFSVKASADLNTVPLLYGEATVDGMQNYTLTGEVFESSETNAKIEVPKNSTKLTIIKKEKDSEIRLKGVVFNLLDEKKAVLKENLETDENGEIIIENLFPGKYYLTEIKTLNGYELFTNIIEVNLELNKDVEIVVNNEKKEVLESKKNIAEDIIIEKVSKEIIEKKTLPVTGY